ncbi:family 20 glycosylhydrolase [Motilimonas cestriensis]|uniref:beta-N-acetylhexosaminidase n=1 Tax=Motilimonas cestriensis TaxID=2742685 RepID=A0ABS8W8V2_9GAMM|nr:family 20 glycosylhydrolase [Motilimonas cestriensis]MCE2595439.1 family 20 glycosylhydrolase [Motilimonas cestriensis]
MAIVLEINELRNGHHNYNADFTLTNLSQTSLKDWTLNLFLVGLIDATQLKNVELVRQDGSFMAFKPSPMTTLDPGEVFNFTIQADKLALNKMTDLPSGIYISQADSQQVLQVEFAPFILPHVEVAARPELHKGEPKGLSIIPQPEQVELTGGIIEKQPHVWFINQRDLDNETQVFLSQLSQHSLGEENSITIDCQWVEGLAHEAYEMVIDNEIIISASDKVGFSHALTSLAQSLNANIPLAQGTVKDQPRFGYRGFMLDCVRHFRSVDKIKQVIDLLAYYKFNTLHWHFTDDEAWRIEIKAFPQLTDKTAYRGHGLAIESQFGSGSEPYGGFYSQEQAKEIVAYAAKRHIQVIPEIDIPGHSRAAIKALPELLVDPDDRSQYCSVQFYTDNVLNPALEGTYHFIDQVIDELCDIFPAPYLHVGADEVPEGVWEHSAACKKMLADNNYQDLRELQGHLLRYAQDRLRQKGKTLLGWEEAIHGDKLEKDAGIYAWRSVQSGITAANDGYKVIATPAQLTYLDMAYNRSEAEPGTTWATDLELEVAYGYEPLNEHLSEAGKENIMGVQYALWSEFVRTDSQFDYMVFPRLLAGAEIAWSQPKRKDWHDFQARLNFHFDYLDHLGIKYRHYK